MKEKDPRLEKLAEHCHNEQWSGWMRYLVSKCEVRRTLASGVPDGRIVIPSWATERWMRQTNTAYAELSEQEKESDRIEAQAILDLLDYLEATDVSK